MNFHERTVAPQQRHAGGLEPPAVVGHAAPLRAKIAQFESKGSVPVPRGSFGIGAPPEQQKGKRELYGNRMKPARLPVVPRPTMNPSPAKRHVRSPSYPEDGEDVHVHASSGGPEIGIDELKTDVIHDSSAPESPVGTIDVPASEPSSPSGSNDTHSDDLEHNTEQGGNGPEEEDVGATLTEVVPAASPSLTRDSFPSAYVGTEEGLLCASPPPTLPLSPSNVVGQQHTADTEDSYADADAASAAPSPPPLPPHSPSDLVGHQRTHSADGGHADAEAAHKTYVETEDDSAPASPPPLPPHSPFDLAAGGDYSDTKTTLTACVEIEDEIARASPTPLPPHSPSYLARHQCTHSAHADAYVNAKYGTISLGMPPHASRAAPQWNRTGHESQPSFSAVVHGRVRELTGGHEKRLPPTPMSPGYASSNSDLVALVQVSAALERRLVAGDLPDDALRRMSAVAAMPTGRGAFVPAHAPAAASGLYHGAAPAPSHADDVHGKPKHTFRNPLARSRLKGNAKQHKEDVALAAPFSLDHYHAPGETPPPPPPKSPPQNNPHLSGWRRFANTSRGTHHAPAVPG